MNMNRHLVIWFIIVALIFPLTACDVEKPTAHTFRQERKNVEKVEICTYNHNEGIREPLAELSEREVDELWTDILSLEMYQFVAMDTLLSYGDVVIFISYLDGEAEIIGITNIGWVTTGGTLVTTNHWFDIEDICAVIAKYVDAETLANVSGYF